VYTLTDIQQFVADEALEEIETINEDTDIYDDLSCVGDDFHELIENYSAKFNVTMDGYLWYFHSDEEGQNFGALFFKPPYQRVQRIPVTPKMLLDFANKGYWDITYPEHRLPKWRYDIIIGLLLLVVLPILLYYCSH